MNDYRVPIFEKFATIFTIYRNLYTTSTPKEILTYDMSAKLSTDDIMVSLTSAGKNAIDCTYITGSTCTSLANTPLDKPKLRIAFNIGGSGTLNSLFSKNPNYILIFFKNYVDPDYPTMKSTHFQMSYTVSSYTIEYTTFGSDIN